MTKFIEDFEAGKVKIKQLIAPGILVKVLPRPETSSLLYIPEAHRNSVNREGIVLQVFEPKNMMVNNKFIMIKPTVNVGDHILFPWWAGKPLDGVSDSDDTCPYRVLQDRTLASKMDKSSGEPFAVISETTDFETSAILNNVGWEEPINTAYGLIERLKRNYIFIPKDQKASLESSNPHKHDV